MAVRLYTRPRIISSVTHQCVKAAVKGLSFRFAIARRMKMSRRWNPEQMILFGSILLVSGCMLGPDFKTPPTTVADKWLEQGNKAVNSTASEHRDWWTVFNDPTLTRLIQL